MNEMVRSDQVSLPAPITSGIRPAAIIPQSMDDAYRLGKAICMAGMAPKGMDTPEKCMIAIMRGLEVGLTPMQALDKIAIVNGRPTIWGDGALGLVRGSGLCAWLKETIEGENDAMQAICLAQRKGEPEPTPGRFSVADAKKAGLWGKAGPWQQFPKRMLQMRARAYCLRDGFADVLGGLYLKEELDGEADPSPRRIAPSASAPMIEARPEASERPTETRRAPSASAQPAKPEPASAASQAVASHYDPEDVRARFMAACAAAKDRGDVDEAWTVIVEPHEDDIFPGDKTEMGKIYDRRLAELEGDGP